jgi:hypothetical protein
MSGTIVPGVNTDENKPEQDPATLSVAPAAQRFAQNDPKFDQDSTTPAPALSLEPDDAGPARMAGFDRIGLDAVSLSVENDATAPRNRAGASTAQDQRNDQAVAENQYSGNTEDSQRRILNWIMSGAADGMISSRVGAKSENDEIDIKKEREDFYYAYLSQWEDNWDDINNMFDDINLLHTDLENTEIEVQNTIDDLSLELEMLDGAVTRHQTELENLKQQLEGASGSEREALEAQIAAKERELKVSQDMRNAYAETNEKLTSGMQNARDAITQSRDNIHELREQMRDASPEERAALEIKLQEEKEKLRVARESLDQLKEDARLTREMTAMGRDRHIDANEMNRLHQMSENSPSFREIAKNMLGAAAASGAMNGMTVSGVNGESLTGENASKYLMAQMGITELDTARYKTEQALAQDPENKELQQKVNDLNERRYVMEQEAKACIADQASDLRSANSPAQQEINTLKSDLAGLTANTVTLSSTIGEAVVFKDPEGAFAIQYVSGGSLVIAAVADQANAAELMKEINAQLATGKTLGTDAITAQQEKLSAAETALAKEQINNDTYHAYASERAAKERQETTAKSADENAEKSASSQQAGDLRFDTPDYTLAQAEESQRKIDAAIAAAVNSGQPMSVEQYEKLKSMPGVTAAALDREMAENGVKKQDGILSEFGMKPAEDILKTSMIMTAFPIIGVYGYQASQINTPSFEPSPLGIMGGNYTSFADSMEFSRYNDPKMIEPSYQNSLSAPVMLAGLFGMGGPTLTPAQDAAATAERLRLEQERILAWQRQQQQDLMAGMGAPKPPSSDSQHA